MAPKPKHQRYARRLSNDLAGSDRLDQLRELQSQLSVVIRDANDDFPEDDARLSCIDGSHRSTSTISRRLTDASCSGSDSRERVASEGSEGSGLVEKDLESGLQLALYRPKRRPSVIEASSSPIGSLSSDDAQSSLSADASERSTDPTVATDRTGALDSSGSSRKFRWPRARSRSLPRRRGPASKAERRKLDGSARSTSSRRSLAKRGSLRRLPNYDFLSKDDDKEERSLRPGAKWWHGVFLFSLAAFLACLVTLWAPYPIGARMPTEQVAETPWSSGCKNGLGSCICPRETICADDLLSMIFLTIARASAWFNYPLYMLLFLSKANNLNQFLQKTALRCWINFSDYHRVHSLFGMILLWTTTTGVTGLVALLLTPPIVLPMTMPYLKTRMTFEWRKGLHYLSVFWCLALMFHAPSRIFWLLGVPLFVYVADKIAEGLFKTHLLESAHFQRLGDSSCLISFENPPGFGRQNSAYVYLMLPWLSRGQFHAFSVFPGKNPNHSSICITKCGDWTGKLMKAVPAPCHKPAFVVGPFLSPFSSPAMDSENLVAVASGIGVTPAISLIRQYASTSRRLNLIWVCRDAGLVEHFLANVDFGSTAGYTLIYYTGKDRGIILRDELPSNVFLFNGRPNLERTISGIIKSIATGEGLPEELQRKVLTRTPAEMRTRLLLEKALSIYTLDQLFEYTMKASEHHDASFEPFLDEVNFAGVQSTMRHLLGDDFDDVTENIARNFDKVDMDGERRLSREGFRDFFDMMIESASDDAQGVDDVKRGLQRMATARGLFDNDTKEPKSEQQKDEFGIKQHLQSDGKFAAKNWAMLYCGGSQPVLDQLKAFKRNRQRVDPAGPTHYLAVPAIVFGPIPETFDAHDASIRDDEPIRAEEEYATQLWMAN
ncbi:hypothetical protein ACHAXT_004665 [Thalassiosira profunda]